MSLSNPDQRVAYIKKYPQRPFYVVRVIFCDEGDPLDMFARDLGYALDLRAAFGQQKSSVIYSVDQYTGELTPCDTDELRDLYKRNRLIGLGIKRRLDG